MSLRVPSFRSNRRAAALGLALALAATGCRRDEGRCAMCGMKVDPRSAWRAEVVTGGSTRSVDTPRCAFAALHAARAANASNAAGAPGGARLRLQDYYDRAWHDEADLVFVTGSDVLGPMGPDLVPVLPGAAAAFARDHGKREVLRAEQVSPEVLSSL